MKQKIIVILGPTAVGKSSLGIRLAKEYNGEIISGDSQQVYRQLDIGTAKVTLEEQKEVKHYLIDVREVSEKYSAFDFVTEAKEAILAIESKKKLPIIVGGTGLYLQSLIEGYHLGGSSHHSDMMQYRQILSGKTDEELYHLLDSNHIILAEKNRRRAIRRLEIAKFGKGLDNRPLNRDVLVIGLNRERHKLYDAINARVDTMIEEGLVDEAKWLYDHYPKAQAANAIGYKEFFPYFDHQITFKEASEHLKQNTRRFAKRQLTWFKNRMQVSFIDVDTPDFDQIIKDKVESFLDV